MQKLINKKIGWIDSPKTKVVYGFMGKEGDLVLTDLNGSHGPIQVEIIEATIEFTTDKKICE